MAYEFDTVIQRNENSKIAIDTKAKYGYWERHDGTEGGGLWFDRSAASKRGLVLVDYDGAGILPKQVVQILHTEGFIPDSELLLY